MPAIVAACPPLPPQPTLLDAWRMEPVWVALMSLSLIGMSAFFWWCFQRARTWTRATGFSWSPLRKAYVSVGAFIVLVGLAFDLGIEAPLNDAYYGWLDHLRISVSVCPDNETLYLAAAQPVVQFMQLLNRAGIAIVLLAMLAALGGAMAAARIGKRVSR